MRVRRLPVGVAVLLMAAGCSGSDGPGPVEPEVGPPAALVAVGATDRQAVAGGAVSDSLAVRVTDSRGKSVAGATVAWSVVGGGGAVAPGSTRTDVAGVAKTAWTLGTAAGENAVAASVGQLPAVRFTATGSPGAAASITMVSGNAQIGAAGAALPAPLSVRVTDRFGNPVGGASVAWSVTSGGGRIVPGSAAADSAGIATAQWELGSTFGSQSAAAEAAAALRVEFAATADPAYPGRAAPVQLSLGGTAGRSHFAIGNTARGGQGEPISGLSCIRDESDIAYHEHAHVSLFVNGEQIAIPAAIGVTEPVVDPRVGDGFVAAGRCFYWLHTHDATGIVHVEPPTTARLTLGQLFDLWGQPLSRDDVAGFRGPVTAYVDGELFRGDPRGIPFTQHGHVSLQVGTKLAPIPRYTFPSGY